LKYIFPAGGLQASLFMLSYPKSYLPKGNESLEIENTLKKD
jgi:hypothetical protein